MGEESLGPTIVIDPRLCIGCRACEVACEREHGRAYISVEFIESYRMFVALNCRHCSKAPCVTVCPVEACTRTPEGAVVINPVLCIGCRLCGVVCPFGIPEFDRRRRAMVKCDMCIDRVREGLLPLCVTTCPTDALKFVSAYAELARERRREAAEKIVRASTELEELSRGYPGLAIR